MSQPEFENPYASAPVLLSLIDLSPDSESVLSGHHSNGSSRTLGSMDSFSMQDVEDTFSDLDGFVVDDNASLSSDEHTHLSDSSESSASTSVTRLSRVDSVLTEATRASSVVPLAPVANQVAEIIDLTADDSDSSVSSDGSSVKSADTLAEEAALRVLARRLAKRRFSETEMGAPGAIGREIECYHEIAGDYFNRL